MACPVKMEVVSDESEEQHDGSWTVRKSDCTSRMADGSSASASDCFDETSGVRTRGLRDT